jgi:hypothetical protein
MHKSRCEDCTVSVQFSNFTGAACVGLDSMLVAGVVHVAHDSHAAWLVLAISLEQS